MRLEYTPFDSVDITLADSLWRIFDSAARRQGISGDQAITCVIDAVLALSKEDFINLREPRRTKGSRICNWIVERSKKYALERFSFENGMSHSSLLRRVLHAILISKQFVIMNSKYEPGMRLRRTQMHFSFIKNYRRAQPAR
jgi:hypothetical protein